MKSFEFYLLEQKLIDDLGISRSELYCKKILAEQVFQINEFVSLIPTIVGSLTSGGSSKPKKIEDEIKDQDKKIFIIEFLKSAVKKLGLLVVIGALIYLGIKTGIISQLLSWAGSIIARIASWISSFALEAVKKAFEQFSNYMAEFGEQINDKTGAVAEYLKDVFKKTTGAMGSPEAPNPWTNPAETDFLGNPRTVLTPKESPKPLDWDKINDFFRDKKVIDPSLLK